eukprot:gene26096-31513_t
MASFDRLKEYSILSFQKLQEVASQHADVVITNDPSTKIRRVSVSHNAETLVGWVINEDVKYCMECTASFGVLKRPHHCRRKCGNIICHKCSSMTTLQDLQNLGVVRVCISCITPTLHADAGLVKIIDGDTAGAEGKVKHTPSARSNEVYETSVLNKGKSSTAAESSPSEALCQPFGCVTIITSPCSDTTTTINEGGSEASDKIFRDSCSDLAMPTTEPRRVECDSAMFSPLVIEQHHEDPCSTQPRQTKLSKSAVKDFEAKYNSSIKGMQSLATLLTCTMTELEELKMRKSELEANNARQATSIALLNAKIYKLKQDFRKSLLEEKSDVAKKNTVCYRCSAVNDRMRALQQQVKDQKKLLKAKDEEYAVLNEAYRAMQADHFSLAKVQDVDRRLSALVQSVTHSTIHSPRPISRGDRVAKTLVHISEMLTRLTQNDDKENVIN